MRSMFGVSIVGCPRNDRSPQPMSSIRKMTTFGRGACAAGAWGWPSPEAVARHQVAATTARKVEVAPVLRVIAPPEGRAARAGTAISLRHLIEHQIDQNAG